MLGLTLVASSSAQSLTPGRPELVPQTGHAGGVGAVAFSPDGRLVASGSADRTVKLREAATGRELRTLTGHTGGVASVAISPDSRWLASGSWDSAIKLWEVTSGRELRTLSGHRDPVSSVAFSPDGRVLASGGRDGLVKLWDVVTGAPIPTLPAHAARVNAVAFSPDGLWLASGSGDTTIKLWGSTKGRLRKEVVRTLVGHTRSVENVAFSPDGRWLASGSADRTIKLWEVVTGRELYTLTGDVADSSGDVAGVAFSPDGRRLASVSWRSVKLWDVAAARVRHTQTMTGHVDQVKAVAFSPDGRRLASASWDAAIKLWDVAAGQELHSLAGRSPPVQAVAFGPDGRWLGVGSRDRTVKLWEVTTGYQVHGLTGHSQRVNAIALSHDGSHVASGSDDRTVKVWETTTGRELHTLAGHTALVSTVAFSPDGRLVASGRLDSALKLWDVTTGQERWTLAGHTRLVSAVAFSPDGRWLASTSEDGTVKLWEVATGREQRTLTGHAGEVMAGAFSPDGRWLASAGWDHTVRLWDVATGHDGRVLAGHEQPATAVAFEPLGRWLASGSHDQTIRLWSVATGDELRSLAGHTQGITGVAVSPDGRWLASASWDGTTRIWDPDTGDTVATLVAFREGTEWLVVTPDGLFDGTPSAWDRILWRFSDDTFDVAPAEVFFNEFFSPGVLADILAGRKPRAPRDISRIDRRQPRVKLSLADGRATPARISTPAVSLRIEVAEAPSDRERAVGSGARDIRLFRNGSLVRAWRGDVLPGKAGRVALHTTVPIVAGENRLTAYAFNRDNVKSSDATVVVTGTASLKRARTAHVLTVGINEYANRGYNLRYAVADAQAFGEELRRQQTQLGFFSRIEVIPLLDGDATKTNVLRALKRLAGTEQGRLPPGTPAALHKTRPIEPDDALFVYFAGHGTAHGERFYLLPHDLGYRGTRTELDEAGLKTMLAHGISDLELEHALEKVDAGRLVLVIDACNSGQALEAEEKRRGPMNSKGLAQLAYEKGMYVLTAAQGYQAALEAAPFGHGLLTYALVEEGLKAAAADLAPTDGQVVVREWLDYATRRVPRMQREIMEQARAEGRGIAFVDGEETIAELDKRSLQHPRVFYRREPDAQPLIVAKPGASRPNDRRVPGRRE